MLSLQDEIKFAQNAEARCPCVLLLDTSGSMSGARIAELNKGLQAFQSDLNNDSLASKRVEVAIVTFSSSVVVVQPFTTANDFCPPTLAAGGLTHMGEGIHKALDMINVEKAKYLEAGIAYYRPWIFLVTDGHPEGESPSLVQEAARRVKNEDNDTRKGVVFFAVGVEQADMGKLQEISRRTPVKLQGLDFRQMFLWLSASMGQVSHSNPDDQVALPFLGWASI